MKRAAMLGFATVVMAASQALAQGTAAPPASTNQAAPSGAVTNSASGIQKATTATMAVRFLSIRSVDLMATKLIGVNVYNNQNKSLGEIEDLVLDNGKTLSGVVISVGGFLGIGEHYVIVDPATMVVQVTDSTMKAYINTTKDNLKGAPTFTYAKNKTTYERSTSTSPQAAGMTSYSAPLKASAEVPPNDSKGTGSVDAKFDPASKMLTWTITYSGLTGPVTAAHFHGPAEAGKNAPPVVPINGNLASPIKGSATLTDAQVKDLQAGHWYFNVHTAAHKDGELRGQLSR